MTGQQSELGCSRQEEKSARGSQPWGWHGLRPNSTAFSLTQFPHLRCRQYSGRRGRKAESWEPSQGFRCSPSARGAHASLGPQTDLGVWCVIEFGLIT